MINDRPVPVRFEAVLRSRLHQVQAEPPQSLAKPDLRRRLVVGYLTAEGAHPRGVEVRRSRAWRAIRGLAGSAEQAPTVHPRSVTIQVRQPREHVADGSVNRRARLVSNRSGTHLLHARTAPRNPTLLLIAVPKAPPAASCIGIGPRIGAEPIMDAGKQLCTREGSEAHTISEAFPCTAIRAENPESNATTSASGCTSCGFRRSCGHRQAHQRADLGRERSRCRGDISTTRGPSPSLSAGRDARRTRLRKATAPPCRRWQASAVAQERGSNPGTVAANFYHTQRKQYAPLATTSDAQQTPGCDSFRSWFSPPRLSRSLGRQQPCAPSLSPSSSCCDARQHDSRGQLYPTDSTTPPSLLPVLVAESGSQTRDGLIDPQRRWSLSRVRSGARMGRSGPPTRRPRTATYVRFVV